MPDNYHLPTSCSLILLLITNAYLSIDQTCEASIKMTKICTPHFLLSRASTFMAEGILI